jgi:hypothetical protein
MGLQKQKVLPNGTEGNYWKITSLVADKMSLKLTVRISLYVSKAMSDDGKINLNVHHIFTGPFTKQELSGDLTALGYQLVKQKVSGAEPVGPQKGLEIMAHRDLTGAIDA